MNASAVREHTVPAVNGPSPGTWRLILPQTPPMPSPTASVALLRIGDPQRPAIEAILAFREGRTDLAVTVHFEIPHADIAKRRQDGHPHVSADLLAGRMVLSLPGPVPGLFTGHDIVLQIRSERLALFVDGVLVDEEWPMARLAPIGDHGAWHLPGSRLETMDRALSDHEIIDLAGGGTAVGRRQLALLGQERRFPAYWRPVGHNTRAGDAMCCLDRQGVLHLFWLYDRRSHRSRWETGAHQFHHASSRDLRIWHRHPPAVHIEHPWESIGTGTCMADAKGFSLYYDLHGERFVAGAAPRGMGLTTSADGLSWTKQPGTWRDLGQPGVFAAPDGMVHLVSRGRRYAPRDGGWMLEDPLLLPVSPAHHASGHARWRDNTDECPCLFSWHGVHYAIMGRTGFWLSDDILGPYWNRPGEELPVRRPRWDIYEGLAVPMAVPFTGDRMLLVGWLAMDGFGGVLVFRELHQLPDGTLALSWVPELTPTAGARLPIPWHRGPVGPAGPSASGSGTGPRQGSAAIRLQDPAGAGSARSVWADLPLEAVRLDATLAIAPGTARVSWIIGADLDGRGGLELRLSPGLGEVRCVTRPVGDGKEPDQIVPCDGHDFAITNVEGLVGTLAITILVIPDPGGGWVIDLELGCGRTLVCWQRQRPGHRLILEADHGSVDCTDASLAIIDEAFR